MSGGQAGLPGRAHEIPMAKKRGRGMIDPGSMLATDAAKKGLGLVLGDIYETLKGAAKRRWARWRATASIDDLYRKIEHVRLVKTILQLDKEVDLATFYHPTRIEQGRESVPVADVDRFPESGNILVSGTVGQGKS